MTTIQKNRKLVNASLSIFQIKEKLFMKTRKNDSVTLVRPGSGGEVLPEKISDDWVSAIRFLKSDSYDAKLTIAIFPSDKIGTDGFLSCKMVFLPGNEKGEHTQTIDGKKMSISEGPNDLRFGNGNFTVHSNFSDMKKLHQMLGTVLRRIKRRKK